MSKSKELYTTTKLVKQILEQDKRARNSDSFLYFRVLGVLGQARKIDIDSMSVPTFLLNMAEYGFPCFETVRRTRQKLQQHYPELAANSDVEAQRMLNEEEYRDYARQVMV